MFLNDGEGSFVDVARAVGTDSHSDARGVAVADFNADGRMDIVINNNNAPPTLYLNNLRTANNWIALDLRGARSEARHVGRNRDAIGAVVTVRAGGAVLVRHVEAGGGYASQSARTLHFGLGSASEVDAIEIVWPSGTRQVLGGASVAVNTRTLIREPVPMLSTSNVR